MLLIVDFSVYNYWYTQSAASTSGEKDTEAKANIRQFYAWVINGMDVRYKNIQTSAYTISIVYSGIYIADQPSKSSFTENNKDSSTPTPKVVAGTVLDDVTSWVQSSSGLPSHDHAMMFSRYDFTSSGSSSNAGLAWVGAVCTTQSVSIVEDHFNFIILTVAAHELGHSLSAEHDGTNNACNGADAYIMAASSSTPDNTNPWKFSSCSTTYFTNYINTLNSGSGNCMTTLSASFDPTALNQYTSLPGQIYDADAMCKHIVGSGSSFCQFPYSYNFTSLCTTLWCYKTDGSGQCESALGGDGLQCGNRKWCVSGECVYDDCAPSGDETCLYGDSSGVIINFNGADKTCADIDNEPSICYSGEVGKKCCKTCGKHSTGRQGCEYGDKTQGCTSAFCPQYGETLCCGTCYTGTTVPSPTTTPTPNLCKTTTTSLPTTTSTEPTTTTTSLQTTSTIPTTTTTKPTTTTTKSTTTTTMPTTTTIIPTTTTALPTTTTTTEQTTTISTPTTPTTTPTTPESTTKEPVTTTIEQTTTTMEPTTTMEQTTTTEPTTTTMEPTTTTLESTTITMEPITTTEPTTTTTTEPTTTTDPTTMLQTTTTQSKTVTTQPATTTPTTDLQTTTSTPTKTTTPPITTLLTTVASAQPTTSIKQLTTSTTQATTTTLIRTTTSTPETTTLSAITTELSTTNEPTLSMTTIPNTTTKPTTSTAPPSTTTTEPTTGITQTTTSILSTTTTAPDTTITPPTLTSTTTDITPTTNTATESATDITQTTTTIEPLTTTTTEILTPTTITATEESTSDSSDITTAEIINSSTTMDKTTTEEYVTGSTAELASTTTTTEDIESTSSSTMTSLESTITTTSILTTTTISPTTTASSPTTTTTSSAPTTTTQPTTTTTTPTTTTMSTTKETTTELTTTAPVTTTETATVRPTERRFIFVIRILIVVTEDFTIRAQYLLVVVRAEAALTALYRRRLGRRFKRCRVRRVRKGSLNVEYDVITDDEAEATSDVVTVAKDLVYGKENVTYDGQEAPVSSAAYVDTSGNNVNISITTTGCELLESSEPCGTGYVCYEGETGPYCRSSSNYDQQMLIIISAVVGAVCLIITTAVVLVLCLCCKKQQKKEEKHRYGIENPAMIPDEFYSNGRLKYEIDSNRSYDSTGMSSSFYGRRWYPGYSDVAPNGTWHQQPMNNAKYSIPRPKY